MELAGRIDHTILKAEASPGDVDRLVGEAQEHGFASVCVNGRYVGQVKEGLRGSGVKTCVVASFPLGAMKPSVKAMETTALCKAGAEEVDFVAWLPALLEADRSAAEADFLEVTRNARSVNPDVVVKVIIESALLMQGVDEATAERRIETACLAARATGCDYVKTSSGFHPAGGATVEAVRLMKRFAAPLKVKASGGIRTREDAMAMVEAGADRLGCSAGVEIVGGGKS